MEKFNLRILNGTQTYSTSVVAEEFEIEDTGRAYYFRDDDYNIVAAYPTSSTIIESIELVDAKSTENNCKFKHNVTQI